MTTPEPSAPEPSEREAWRDELLRLFEVAIGAWGDYADPATNSMTTIRKKNQAMDAFRQHVAALKPSPSPVVVPVEISSCATCGHPVESGGERPAAAIEALRELVTLKALKGYCATLLHMDGDSAALQMLEAEYERRKPLAWASARAALSASGSQDSGSTECKESSPLSPANQGIDHE